MNDTDVLPTENVEQHPRDSVAFKDMFQADDGHYAWAREVVIQHLEQQGVAGEMGIDLSKIQIRRLTIEDGVISYDATHPRVTHEDEMPEDAVPAEFFEDTQA